VLFAQDVKNIFETFIHVSHGKVGGFMVDELRWQAMSTQHKCKVLE